jgi:hypothetical protein
MLFFLICTPATAELGTAFTDESGSHAWTKLAWGRFVAAINSVLYRLSNPVWMGGLLCITAVTTFNTFSSHAEASPGADRDAAAADAAKFGPYKRMIPMRMSTPWP